MTTKKRKTDFLKELKALAVKNGLKFDAYTTEQLFSKLGRFKHEKKLKGVRDYNYLVSIAALYWVSDNF